MGRDEYLTIPVRIIPELLGQFPEWFWIKLVLGLLDVQKRMRLWIVEQD